MHGQNHIKSVCAKQAKTIQDINHVLPPNISERDMPQWWSSYRIRCGVCY